MSKKCKLLILTDTRVGVPGGSERHLLNFLTNMSSDFTAKVFQLNPGGNKLFKEGCFEPNNNVELYLRPLETLKSLTTYRLLIELYKLCLNEKPDIVISYHEKSDLINYFLSKMPLMNHKTVSSKRDMGLKLTGKLGYVMSRVNPSFDAITAPSKSVIEQAIDQFGAIEKKSYVVENGVDLSRYKQLDSTKRNELRVKLGLPINKKIVITVGWLREGKGHEYLINGLAKLDRVEDWFLVLLGEGPDLARLEKIAAENQLSDQVLFAGMQRNVDEWLSVSDVAVSASLSEGLSNALVEATASSLPIIATNVGGNPEVVEDGFNGFLVKERSASSIEIAFNKLKFKDVIIEMGANSRKKSEQTFSIEKMVTRLEDIYLRLSGVENEK